MKKQLRDIIQQASARATMAADIITSVLPEVVRSNVRQILAPYLGEPEQQAQGAGECPFGHSAAPAAATPSEAGKCPVTGQTETPGAASDAVAKESAPAAKPASKEKAAPKKAAPKKAAPKAKKSQSTPKKPAAKKAAKKPAKAAAKKKPAAKKSAPKSVKTSDLTVAKLQEMTVKDGLNPIAQELEIRGRSSMKKSELIDAIKKELDLS